MLHSNYDGFAVLVREAFEFNTSAGLAAREKRNQRSRLTLDDGVEFIVKSLGTVVMNPFAMKNAYFSIKNAYFQI